MLQKKYHTYDWSDKEYPIKATHWTVNSHAFKKDEGLEADFICSLAEVGEKNGISAGEIHQVIKFALRMLRSNNGHAGNTITNPNTTDEVCLRDSGVFYTQCETEDGKPYLASTHKSMAVPPNPPFLFDISQREEVALATTVGRLAEKNGLTHEDTKRVYVHLLRMLNSPISENFIK